MVSTSILFTESYSETEYIITTQNRHVRLRYGNPKRGFFNFHELGTDNKQVGNYLPTL